MPSPTPSNKIELQAYNSNNNTWGVDHLNPALDCIDQALDGVLELNIGVAASPTTLTPVDYVVSNFRNRIIHLTGTRGSTFVLNLPTTIEKWYVIVNDATTAVSINGAFTIATPGIYHAFSYGGSVEVLERATKPPTPLVVDNISVGAIISIAPDLLGSVYVVDPFTVQTINIDVPVTPNSNDPRYTGQNTISVPNDLNSTKVAILGLYNADNTPLPALYIGTLVGLECQPAYVTIARIPGTDNMMVTEIGYPVIDN